MKIDFSCKQSWRKLTNQNQAKMFQNSFIIDFVKLLLVWHAETISEVIYFGIIYKTSHLIRYSSYKLSPFWLKIIYLILGFFIHKNKSSMDCTLFARKKHFVVTQLANIYFYELSLSLCFIWINKNIIGQQNLWDFRPHKMLFFWRQNGHSLPKRFIMKRLNLHWGN